MNSKTVLHIVGVGVGVVLVGAALYFGESKKPYSTTLIGDISPTTTQVGLEIDENINKGWYVNPNFAFSFTPPDGYTVTSFDDTDQSGTPVTTVIVDDQTKSKGVQIVISAWDESPDTLTPERIARDIPNMKIADVSVRDVPNIGTVIEFTSDSADFGGSSREVWFVAHGDLYQMSTYSENRAVLDAVLATWKFQ